MKFSWPQPNDTSTACSFEILKHCFICRALEQALGAERRQDRRLAILTEIRDLKRRQLHLLREDTARVDEYNANLEEAVRIIEQQQQ